MIHAVSAHLVTQAVVEGSADIGISIETPGQAAEGNFTPLLQEDFVLICPAGDPLARRKWVDCRIFADRPFVLSGSASSIHHVTARILAASGLAPEMNYVSDNISVVGAMVAAGVGIAAVPKLALRLMDTGRLQSVALRAPAAAREIGILTKRQRSLSAAVLRFVETMQQVCPAVMRGG